MDKIDEVLYFNHLSGNDEKPKGFNSDLAKVYKSLVLEEVEELMEAETLEDQLDALGDLFVVVTGGIYALGKDPHTVYGRVNQSNFSKFCDFEDDAVSSVEAYKDDERYEDVHYIKRDGIYVIVGRKAGTEESSAYKILKGIHYQPPKLENI